MAAVDLGTLVRLAAFDFPREQTELHGTTQLPRDVLTLGFLSEDRFSTHASTARDVTDSLRPIGAR